MTLRLVLTRHGQSTWHADDRYAGRSDIELTAVGHEQAARLAGWASTAGLDAVWSSGLDRARRTAEPAATASGLPLQVDPRLVELDFGVAEGLTKAELAARLPSETAAFNVDPVDHHFPRGEHPAAAIDRYVAVIDELRRTHDGGRVLVVAHSTAMRLTLCRLLSIDPARYRLVMPALLNCSLTEVELHEDHASMLRFNCPLGPDLQEAP